MFDVVLEVLWILENKFEKLRKIWKIRVLARNTYTICYFLSLVLGDGDCKEHL